MYKNFFKRIIDFCLALSGFILLLPVFLILTLILFIDFKGGPFFKQDRPGKNEKIFHVLKFKTMNNKKDAAGNLLPDSDRITKLGMFIRRTSLDEIPQLINVIKGDMSIIGPRPLRTFYLPFYSEEERKRHSVRPGITGLAQISGRNFVLWEERFRLDVAYASNVTFSEDFKILIATVKKVFSSSDLVIDQNKLYDPFHIYRQKQIESGTFNNN